MNMHLDWDLDLPTFRYFDGILIYNLCLTRFVFDLILLFWTSSQLSVTFWNCRLLFWKIWFSGVSKIRRDCILSLFKCWALSTPS